MSRATKSYKHVNHKVTHPPLSMVGVIVEEKEQLEALGCNPPHREQVFTDDIQKGATE